jgi:hypothetical protein
VELGACIGCPQSKGGRMELIQRAIVSIVLVGVPALVLMGGDKFMSSRVGRQEVFDQLKSKADRADRKPPNQRICGYDMPALSRYWAALDEKGLMIEKQFLQIDLIFPIILGSALLGSLLVAWSYLGRTFQIGWIIVPILIAIASDWAENIIQLKLLGQYIGNPANAIPSAPVTLASVATSLKWLFFALATLLLVALVLRILASSGVSGLTSNQSLQKEA